MQKNGMTGIFGYLLHRLNAYSSPGLLLRILHDLVVSNAGMFLGAVFTITFWIDNPVIPRYHFQNMFINTWLENIPLVTLSCLIGYGMTGLYGVTRENRFRKILIAVAEAVTAALLIHLPFVFQRQQDPPEHVLRGVVFRLCLHADRAAGAAVFLCTL